jgi:hypothetical protein
VIYESLLIYKQIYDTYSNKSNDNSNISQDIFKNIYVPKCLCLASVHPSINKFELILRALYENFQLGKNYFFDLVIEKLVSQTPKIPKGLKKIYLKINEGIIVTVLAIAFNTDINFVENLFRLSLILSILFSRYLSTFNSQSCPSGIAPRTLSSSASENEKPSDFLESSRKSLTILSVLSPPMV